MPKALTLGNGSVLVTFDRYGQVYDLYFPYVGLENQIGNGYLHKIGVQIDGNFSWLDDGTWEISVDCADDALVSDIKAINHRFQLEILFNDVVYNEKNILIRKIQLHNLVNEQRYAKLFINHQFELYESHRGDTAYYDPLEKVLIHYKGRRVFLANLITNGEIGITDYSIGLLGMEGKEGTYKDAEDGNLSKNPIEHGLVDSVCAASLTLPATETVSFYYWLTVSKYLAEVYFLNNYVIQRSPEYLISSTRNYWKAWASKERFSFYGLKPEVVKLFTKSLFNIRTHFDNHGGVIASGDSDLLKQGRDTYCYVWPRDAAFASVAMDKARYFSTTNNYFQFCRKVLHQDGYMLHKYRADFSLGSSWHPWVRGDYVELPIQEDETALVLIALWNHYLLDRQIEFIEELFNPLVRKAADFMVSYIDERTGLPRPSYDLWEEKFGVSTFTCAAVAQALEVAGKFAQILGKTELSEKYLQQVEVIRRSIMGHLYNEQEGYFYKMINTAKDGTIEIDHTMDMSSVYAAFKFQLIPLHDEKMSKLIKLAESKLTNPTKIGGLQRYENDNYFRVHKDSPSNPWFVTTLWLTQYYIAVAQSTKDLDVVMKQLAWITEHQSAAGVLSEQLNPDSGEQISAAPLTWSHAEYVVTIIEYLEKLRDLGVCATCVPPQ